MTNLESVRVGDLEITIEHVEFTSNIEDECGNWLNGVAYVTCSCKTGGNFFQEVEIGCWADTDKDSEWSSWQEGARIIGVCLNSEVSGDMRGTRIQLAFYDESEKLGKVVCSFLRSTIGLF